MALPKILLFDLDETIVFSEEMKTKAWSDILKVFGYCWEEENVDNLVSVPKYKRPNTGLSPHDFIENLIVNLKLPTLNYQDNHEVMIQIMKDHWTSSLIAQAKLFAKEGRIIEVPGAVNTIKEARKKGFRIGVVTQSPVEYAKEVLSFLGLVDRDNEENNTVDVVVSGDMVKKPKPDPESLILATKLIVIQTVIEEREKDSMRKLDMKEKMEIGYSIDHEYFSSHIGRGLPTPFAVIGDSRSDIKAGQRYPGTGRIRKVLINSRNLSPAEIQEIQPNITINHFEELLPRLEGNISKREKL